VLQLLKEKGIEPDVVLYLENTPNADTLKELLIKLAINPRQLIHSGEDVYKENNLGDQNLTDCQLIEAMVTFPKLIQRPIVVNGDKAAIGRPPETVLKIL